MSFAEFFFLLFEQNDFEGTQTAAIIFFEFIFGYVNVAPLKIENLGLQFINPSFPPTWSAFRRKY